MRHASHSISFSKKNRKKNEITLAYRAYMCYHSPAFAWVGQTPLTAVSTQNTKPGGPLAGISVYEHLQKKSEVCKMDALKLMSDACLKAEIPVIEIGDTVTVQVKIREGEKERLQAFEGTVIARKGSGISETFTVRRLSYGVGVERVFPIHSPNVASVSIVRKGHVRRAKLYYLRGRVGKAAKVKEALK